MTRTAKCPHCGGLTVPPRETAVDIRVAAIRALAQDLSGCHDDAWRFLTALFDCERPYKTVIELASDLGVEVNTLLSRFRRAEVPSPKRYLAYARMLRVAASFANEALSIDDIANEHDYSCSQSFNRHVRLYFGGTAGEFRSAETQQSLLARFRKELIQPYRDGWLHFRPLLTEVANGLRYPHARRKAVAA